MALTKTTKTSSIIKTRSQSRTPGTTPRTGTNVRTNDGTIAPAPVAVGTTGRTIDTTTVAPAPVDDLLFAGRPKTGALKDPPPVPRDSDDAKKPAAKPKGRPPNKVVAPKATRKPRKPRNVDANELVDPMANIHFGDDAIGVVTAGGGIARAGGYDPASSRKSGTT